MVTPSPAHDAAAIAEIAKGLTKARQDMILALPADGSWGRVPSRSVAKRAWWRLIPPIIAHKHCPEDANEWALTDYGMLLRASLAQSKGGE